jgi:hypothetical protein
MYSSRAARHRPVPDIAQARPWRALGSCSHRMTLASRAGGTSENGGARRYELRRGRNSFGAQITAGRSAGGRVGCGGGRSRAAGALDLELAYGQGLAQGLALDAVGGGGAVAVGVGQGGAGGLEEADDLELEVAGSGGSACPGGGDGQVQRGRALLLGGRAGAGTGGQQGGDGGRAAGADGTVQGVMPPRSGWSTSAPAETSRSMIWRWAGGSQAGDRGRGSQA